MAFDLSAIRTGPQLQPPRILLYGVHGIGKSTFAAHAPRPIFIVTEDGLGTIDCASFPQATEVAQVEEAMDTLLNEEHDFETVVLDSADWLEMLFQKAINSGYDAKDLAYGKGALILAECWRAFLAKFDRLRRERGMVVILLAHTEIKRFDSPESEPYDRYRPKLQERSSALVQEWADAVLFTNYKTLIKKDSVGFNKEVARGIGTGQRLIYTQETPAYYAKNRYGLPAQLDLSWSAFYDEVLKSTRKGD